MCVEEFSTTNYDITMIIFVLACEYRFVLNAILRTQLAICEENVGWYFPLFNT